MAFGPYGVPSLGQRRSRAGGAEIALFRASPAQITPPSIALFWFPRIGGRLDDDRNDALIARNVTDPIDALAVVVADMLAAPFLEHGSLDNVSEPDVGDPLSVQVRSRATSPVDSHHLLFWLYDDFARHLLLDCEL